MPLLPQEPWLFPDNLLTRAPETAGGNARWWVLHTRPRAEKSLARQLLHNDTAFFLPLAKRRWPSRGRWLCSYKPLFPSYVFFHGDEDARRDALATNLIASCLPVVDQERLHADLTRVHRLMLTDAPLTPEDRLEPGAAVEITGGPFQGLTGTVLRRGHRLRLVVEVQFLRRGVSVELESWMLQPLQKQPQHTGPQCVGCP
jgi:transcriptional antiterminator RfaH